ncbi:MAG: hypothetical protein U9O85_03660 [Euryarchaeota archaeon]|nr:hypothetical protein [Euryarchaeota archaeon]
MNSKGQWILLSGLILAIGLVVLVILLNQAMSAGYKVSAAETDFPSREITEIFEETVRSGNLVWKETKPNTGLFNKRMGYFTDNISKVYAAHGAFAGINAMMVDPFNNTMNVTMRYYDGNVNFTLINRSVQIYG